MISIVLVVSAAISSAQAAPMGQPAPVAAVGGEHPQAGSSAPVWAGFAGNAQHTSAAPASPQPLSRVRWHTPVDPAPDLSSGELLIHYGSPMITAANTVLVPTRVSATAGFQVDAYAGATGARRWSVPTDYRAPASSDDGQTWTPPLPATLATGNRLAVAGGGGTVLMRANADDPTSTLRRRAFYGLADWQAHRAQYNDAVQISTPLTAGPDGSVYFGFGVSGPTPANLSSGIARIDAAGHASWTSASTAAGDPAVTDVALNAAPALSPDGTTVYTTVIGPSASFLVGMDAATLAPRYHAALTDPVSGQPAFVSTSTSATPTIGPDGDVYYGVLENPFPNHNERGWLLHFDATLTHVQIPGSFGWDNTVSILPAGALPAYRGRSPYLVVSKYNNYLGLGPSGDGHNKIAVLDPRASAADPYASVQVMKPVQTILSPVHFPGAPPGHATSGASTPPSWIPPPGQ